MIDTEQFRVWLKKNSGYSDAVISDTISRVKRADSILEWDADELYQFHLEHIDAYKKLTVCVRSQIKIAVSLYRSFHLDSLGTDNDV